MFATYASDLLRYLLEILNSISDGAMLAGGVELSQDLSQAIKHKSTTSTTKKTKQHNNKAEVS